MENAIACHDCQRIVDSQEPAYILVSGAERSFALLRIRQLLCGASMQMSLRQGKDQGDDWVCEGFQAAATSADAHLELHRLLSRQVAPLHKHDSA